MKHKERDFRIVLVIGFTCSLHMQNKQLIEYKAEEFAYCSCSLVGKNEIALWS